MDKAIARGLVRQELDKLRTHSYDSLCELLESPATKIVTGPDGKDYQVEIQAVWDAKPGAELRVVVSVDDAGWRALVPVSDSFIMTPGGEIQGD
jgi:hypothetical protein